MAFRKLTINLVWLLYAIMLGFLSLYAITDYAVNTPMEFVALILKQSLELTILVGLISSIFGWKPNTILFWKVVDSVLAVGVLTIASVGVWMALKVDFTTGLFCLTASIFLMPALYKLTRFAWLNGKRYPNDIYRFDRKDSDPVIRICAGHSNIY